MMMMMSFSFLYSICLKINDYKYYNNDNISISKHLDIFLVDSYMVFNCYWYKNSYSNVTLIYFHIRWLFNLGFVIQ